MQHRREIDGLRALAVLPVILFHAGLPGFAGGFVGVDVFFVISGYLITSIILAEQAAGTFTLAGFYERRARRLLPALFIVLLVSLPCAWFLLTPPELKAFAQSLIGVAVFASNVHFARSSGYFATEAESQPLLHTWSLAVEEQFYLLFPLLLLGLRRWSPGRTRALIGALAMASLGSALWGLHSSPDQVFYAMHARGWELLLGAWIATRPSPQPAGERPGLAAEAGAATGLVLLAISIACFDAQTPMPGLHALVPTLGTALLILHATETTHVGRWLGHPALVSTGLVSYSAYLWHQPLFAFARHALGGPPPAALMLTLALATLALAWWTWRYVERPFRQRGHLERRRIFGLAIAGSTLFLAVGLAGQVTQGFMNVKATDSQRAVLDSAKASPRRKACHTEGAEFLPPAQACSYPAAGQLHWAVLGDSHAVELAQALAQRIGPRGEKLLHLSFSRCIPAFDERQTPEHDACRTWTRQAVAQLEQRAEVQRVVVVYRINAWLFGGHEQAYPAWPDDVGPQERELRWKAYTNLLKHLVAQGKQVVLVLQAPELPRRIDTLLFQTGGEGTDVPGAQRSWWDQRNRYVISRLRELPAEVTVVDPTALLCDTQRCWAARKEVGLYFDDDHLSVAGAGLVADEILRRLPR